MRGHTCYHCKRWVEDGEAHDCWTTTESALTRDLADDLRDAWERLRDAAQAAEEISGHETPRSDEGETLTARLHFS